MGQLVVYATTDAELTHNDLSTTKTFHELVTGTGTSIESGGHSYSAVMLWASTVSTKWRMIRRVGMVFNTAALPDVCTITGVTLTAKCWAKNDGLPCTPNACLYEFSPASEVTLAATDYALFGNVELSDTITYASWPDDGSRVTFTLNAAGRALINKTGNTCLGTRNANYDVADELDPGNHDPTWKSNNDSFLLMYGRLGEAGDVADGPILTIDYTIPTPVVSGIGVYSVKMTAQRGGL
jgi:hypothetical protein